MIRNLVRWSVLSWETVLKIIAGILTIVAGALLIFLASGSVGLVITTLSKVAGLVIPVTAVTVVSLILKAVVSSPGTVLKNILQVYKYRLILYAFKGD